MSDYFLPILLEETDVPRAKLLKEPAECLADELQRWLECHGQKKSGKKQVLVERVIGCFFMIYDLGHI